MSAPDMNRGLSSNFWWLRSANPVWFTKECVMCTEKHVLVKKILTNELNMGLPLQVWVKKIAHGVETYGISRKEKFQALQSVKKVMLTSGAWKNPSLDFLEKGANVNSASYCHLLHQNSPYLFNDPHIYRKWIIIHGIEIGW